MMTVLFFTVSHRGSISPAFFLIIAAAIVAAIADKGLLTGGPFDGNLEEEMELLVYLLQLYFVRWYYRGLEHGTQQPQ